MKKAELKSVTNQIYLLPHGKRFRLDVV